MNYQGVAPTLITPSKSVLALAIKKLGIHQQFELIWIKLIIKIESQLRENKATLQKYSVLWYLIQSSSFLFPSNTIFWIFCQPTLQILDIWVGCNWKSARSVLATRHSCSLQTTLNHIYKKKKEKGINNLLYSIKTIFTINTTANFYLTVKFFLFCDAFFHFGANFVFRDNDRFWK